MKQVTYLNLPESWAIAADMICIITDDPKVIEKRLEACEASLGAIEMSSQPSTAFSSQHQSSSYPNRDSTNHYQTCPRHGQTGNIRSFRGHGTIAPSNHTCLSSGKTGYTSTYCYAQHTNIQECEPWKSQPSPGSNQNYGATQASITPQLPKLNPIQCKGRTRGERVNFRYPLLRLMEAKCNRIHPEMCSWWQMYLKLPLHFLYPQAKMYVLSATKGNGHIWLIDSAASIYCHLSSNKSLFRLTSYVTGIHWNGKWGVFHIWSKRYNQHHDLFWPSISTPWLLSHSPRGDLWFMYQSFKQTFYLWDEWWWHMLKSNLPEIFLYFQWTTLF